MAMADLHMEVLVRLILLAIFIYVEFQVAHPTAIQPEDLWRYRYPYKESQVPFGELVIFIIVTSAVAFYILGWRRRHPDGIRESVPATLGLTASMFVTGVVTNFLKFVVGRPRPNYMVRCYGAANYVDIKDPNQPCLESNDWVGDMRKSFPSGHSSVAFAAFGYLAQYLAGKLGTFNWKGQGCLWRQVVPLVPLVFASWVAVTRLTDYHHHYDDILTGCIIGSVISFLSYRRYYPSLGSETCEYPYKWFEQDVLSHRRLRRNQRAPHIDRGMDNRILNESLIMPVHQVPSTGSNPRLQNVSYNNSNVSMSVYLSRLPSTVLNDPELSVLSRASVSFYWDADDVDESGVSLLTPQDLQTVRQELLAAVENLGRPTAANIEINGNVVND